MKYIEVVGANKEPVQLAVSSKKIAKGEELLKFYNAECTVPECKQMVKLEDVRDALRIALWTLAMMDGLRASDPTFPHASLFIPEKEFETMAPALGTLTYDKCMAYLMSASRSHLVSSEQAELRKHLEPSSDPASLEDIQAMLSQFTAKKGINIQLFNVGNRGKAKEKGDASSGGR